MTLDKQKLITDELIEKALNIYNHHLERQHNTYSSMKFSLEAVFSLIEKESADNARCTITSLKQEKDGWSALSKELFDSLDELDFPERQYTAKEQSKNDGWTEGVMHTGDIFEDLQGNKYQVKEQSDNEGWIYWEAQGNRDFPPNVTPMTLVDIKDSLDPLRDCTGIQAKEVWWSYVKAYRILPNQTPKKEVCVCKKGGNTFEVYLFNPIPTCVKCNEPVIPPSKRRYQHCENTPPLFINK